jgi:hypothetical protein
MFFAADHDRRRSVEPGEATEGVDEHRSAAGDRKERLRHELARQRPQAGADAAGEHDGDEPSGHRGSA